MQKKTPDLVRKVDPGRRSAVRRLLGAGFTLPVVASMAVSSLPITEAHAQSRGP